MAGNARAMASAKQPNDDGFHLFSSEKDDTKVKDGILSENNESSSQPAPGQTQLTFVDYIKRGMARTINDMEEDNAKHPGIQRRASRIRKVVQGLGSNTAQRAPTPMLYTSDYLDSHGNGMHDPIQLTTSAAAYDQFAAVDSRAARMGLAANETAITKNERSTSRLSPQASASTMGVERNPGETVKDHRNTPIHTQGSTSIPSIVITPPINGLPCPQNPGQAKQSMTIHPSTSLPSGSSVQPPNATATSSNLLSKSPTQPQHPSKTTTASSPLPSLATNPVPKVTLSSSQEANDLLQKFSAAWYPQSQVQNTSNAGSAGLVFATTPRSAGMTAPVGTEATAGRDALAEGSLAILRSDGEKGDGSGEAREREV